MNAKINDSIEHTPVLDTFPVIIRSLKDGTKAVFILNSLDHKKGIIEMWPHGSNSNETYTVKLDAYHDSIGVTDTEEKQVADDFTKINNIHFGLVLRKRLWKVSPDHPSVAKPAVNALRRSTDPKPEQVKAPEVFDKEAFVEKMILAVTVALREAIKD